ncbi:unnamed protein product [Schistosoma curassoni]|uniref:Uncharacterized protein n=1 Tax=Schistosoma curassoni TaxID=6186 RepID=A0A183KFI3_9TREM|nr:unnamed protein product [Schistosoma curassoni]
MKSRRFISLSNCFTSSTKVSLKFSTSVDNFL